MKKMFNKQLSTLALLSACAFVGTGLANREVLMRSQSVDSARELAGWTSHINLFDMGCLYGSFAITPEYTQSFRNGRIAKCIFGGVTATNNVNDDSCFNNNCSNSDSNDYSFNVTGSQIANRGATDLLADNFGLSPNYNVTVTVKPKIQNFLVDFDLYLGLDQWLCGLWFRVHAPVVYAKWKLGLTEVANSEATLGYAAGYFAPNAVPLAQLNKDFSSYLAGNVPTLTTATDDVQVTFAPLAFDKVTVANGCDSSSNHTTKLSEIQMALGWNFWQSEDYHLGLGVRAAAPTGTRIGSSDLLFQPVVGNGHHWEVGGMVTSHYTFWRDCNDNHALGLYADLNVTHLFRTQQCRTFDIKGAGQLSRYILLEGLTANTGSLTGSTSHTASVSQFNTVFTPAANVTRAAVKVSIPYQIDFTAMLNYNHCGFDFDLGYNLWAVGCEKIKPCTAIVTPQAYGVKGDAYVYGFVNGTTIPVALAATETGVTCGTGATIYSGTNFSAANGGYTTANTANTGIDNKELAFTGTTILRTAPGSSIQTNTSIQALALADGNLDINGARRKAVTNKVFANISHTWFDCECWIPFLGIGGMAEFASNSCNNNNSVCGTGSCGSTNSCSTSDCNSGCRSCGLSQWGIWLKGGVSF